MKALTDWAAGKGITLFSVPETPKVHAFYLSRGSECLQVVIKTEDIGAKIDIWSVETHDNEDIHKSYSVPLTGLIRELDRLVEAITKWFEGRIPLPSGSFGDTILNSKPSRSS